MSKKHLSMISELLEKCDRLTRELAEAKARAVIPDGWVAVPVEPTQAMRDEGAIQKMSGATVGMIYRAMLYDRPDPSAQARSTPLCGLESSDVE